MPLSDPPGHLPMQVSKARKLQLLLDPSEMEELLSELEPFTIFTVSRPVTQEEAEINKGAFLEAYAQYIAGLCKQGVASHPLQQACFSSVFSCQSDVLYAQTLSNGKILVKAAKPVIQLQKHDFIYSTSFHSGIGGKESVSWGIQFSYPQLYLDPTTQQIGKVDRSEQFPNSSFFHTLTKWVRNHTLPTPFIIGEKQVNQPIRLGKRAFSWIEQHIDLQARGLHVARRDY